VAASAEAHPPAALVQLRARVAAPSPYRLPLLTGADGIVRRSGGVLERLLHAGEVPVRVRAAQARSGVVVLEAEAPARAAAEHGIARMRYALGVDEDVGEFIAAFSRDRLIGASVRRRPWLRVNRRAQPFEALVLAICEQLIEYRRAAQIERRMLARLGRRWPHAGAGAGALRDLPSATALAGTPPALLESCDLSAGRALALVRAAREVAAGRVVLDGGEPERGWRRLRAIPGIGPWTVEMLALRGQGRTDQLPAADVGLLKLVGRALSGGDPRARASEREVREFFAPYGRWAGLAASHMLSL
jgi:3-methyladenine DNA glycosylase/8-oxoguanine DNA glycosylase